MLSLKQIIIGLILVCLCTGCSEGKITDEVTELTIPILQADEEHYLFQSRHHGMANQHMDYVAQELIFDLSHYNENPVAKGDIVLFKMTEGYQTYQKEGGHTGVREEDFSRVIALPGEKLSIRKGQIYINGKKLDTFYGKLKYFGYTNPKSIVANLNACEIDCQREIKEYLQLNFDEIEVPADHVFLISDNSPHALDSKDVGPIPIDLIRGKFLGYLKKR